MKKIIVMAVMASFVLVACQGGGPDVTLPTVPGDTSPTTVAPTTTVAPPDTEAPTTTIAPPDTEAPTTTVVPEDEATGETPWWLLIVVGLGIIILITVFATRGSKKGAVPIAVAPNWKDHARKGYADARWLYDAMGEDLAVWRGNARFDDATATGATAGTSRSETWSQMTDRMMRAADSLYALEAAAPDQRSADLARNAVTTMRSTREVLDARAESRFAYRTTDASEHTDQQLMDAREREVRSSRNLVEARNAFAKALTDLSTIV